VAVLHAGAWRGSALTLFLCVMPAMAVAQAETPSVPVSKGRYVAHCQWGAANAPPVRVGAVVGKDFLRAASSVPRALEAAGLKLRASDAASWEIAVVTTWPVTQDSTPYQRQPHPGVYAMLLMTTRNDSALVYGGVEAICAAAPTAPDSTVRTAQLLMAQQIQSALQSARSNR
jgi:hypothetical protein